MSYAIITAPTPNPDALKFIMNADVKIDGKVTFKSREEANSYLAPKLNGFKWSERVIKWFGGWKYFDELKPMSDTDSYKKIVDYIHSRKSVSKNDILEHLGWGVRISFSEYRNRLRLEDTIKFTKNRYEVI